MNDLVLNQVSKNVGVITLKEITDLITVEHNKAMKVVEKLCFESSFGGVEKIATPTFNPNGSFNKNIDTYLLNKKQAIAVGAKLNNKLLMKVIDRLEELEVKKPLTTSEQIVLLAQGHQEVEQRLTLIEHKIENDITLTSIQKHHLKKAVNIKVYELINNHKLSEDFIKKGHMRVWKKIKDTFIVSSYMEIPKSKFDEAYGIINLMTIDDLM